MIAWMLHNALVATILALLAWGTCHWRRLGPATRHGLWLLVLIKLLTPPIVSWPWAVANPLASAPTIDGAGLPQNETPPASATIASAVFVDSGDRQAPSPWLKGQHWTFQRASAALTVIWLASAAGVLLLQSVRIARMARRVARARQTPALEEAAARLSQTMGLRSVRVRAAEGLASPVVWSFIRPVLLWPAEMPFDTPAGRAMLVHELAHVKRRDHWVGWLKLAAGCLWWWHPVYWFVCRRLGEEAELACDAWAVHRVSQARRAYAQALLEICEKSLPTAPALAVGVLHGGRRIMERRLRMILQENVTLQLPWAELAALSVLALALVPAWAQNRPPPDSRGTLGTSPLEMTVLAAAAPAAALPHASPAQHLDDPGTWIAKANGCLIEQTGARIHIIGTNNIGGWGYGNGVASTKVLPEGDFYACVDFKVPRFEDSTATASHLASELGGQEDPGNTPAARLVYLRVRSSAGQMLAILYQPNAGTYQVQGWGLKGAPNTFSQPPLAKLGDENTTFHRMKLKYDAAAGIAAGWVDDHFIGTLGYVMTGTVTAELLANTDAKGMQIDLLFDNLSIVPNISEAPLTPTNQRNNSP